MLFSSLEGDVGVTIFTVSCWTLLGVNHIGIGPAVPLGGFLGVGGFLPPIAVVSLQYKLPILSIAPLQALVVLVPGTLWFRTTSPVMLFGLVCASLDMIMQNILSFVVC
jgi:hypothetical protein